MSGTQEDEDCHLQTNVCEGYISLLNIYKSSQEYQLGGQSVSDTRHHGGQRSSEKVLSEATKVWGIEIKSTLKTFSRQGVSKIKPFHLLHHVPTALKCKLITN